MTSGHRTVWRLPVFPSLLSFLPLLLESADRADFGIKDERGHFLVQLR